LKDYQCYSLCNSPTPPPIRTYSNTSSHQSGTPFYCNIMLLSLKNSIIFNHAFTLSLCLLMYTLTLKTTSVCNTETKFSLRTLYDWSSRFQLISMMHAQSITNCTLMLQIYDWKLLLTLPRWEHKIDNSQHRCRLDTNCT